MDNLELRVRRGQQAHDLLANDIFVEVMDSLRDRVIDSLENGLGLGGVDDRSMVERLRVLNTIRIEIKAMADDGRVARRQLEDR